MSGQKNPRQDTALLVKNEGTNLLPFFIPKFELHQKCHKDFISPYVGKVTAVPEGGSEFYRVLYEDGDVEDMSAHELEKYGMYYKSQLLEGPPKAKRTKSSNVDVHDPSPYRYEVQVGTKIMKDFFKTYEGEVIKVPTSKRPNSMYRIRFVDGDEEHVTAVELEELVKAYEDYVKQDKASFDSDINTKVESDAHTNVKCDEEQSSPISRPDLDYARAPSAMIPEMESSATTPSQGMLCSITLRRWLHTDGSL
jgi:hypothetical protein